MEEITTLRDGTIVKRTRIDPAKDWSKWEFSDGYQCFNDRRVMALTWHRNWANKQIKIQKQKYKQPWVPFNLGRGVFEAIPQSSDTHSCAHCAFRHTKSCGKYVCKKEDRLDNKNVVFTSL